MTQMFDTKNPIHLFTQWLEEAKTCEAITEPTAMCLATATQQAAPSARIVLLKAHDEDGFVFYTNLESRKSDEMHANPQVAACFYWMPLDKQVRITGRVAEIAPEVSDAYFASRGRQKQLGAWASAQSQPMPKRETFEARIAEYDETFSQGEPIPRPPHWGGWKIVPEKMEFWIQQDYRLHERCEFKQEKPGFWTPQLLFP